VGRTQGKPSPLGWREGQEGQARVVKVTGRYASYLLLLPGLVTSVVGVIFPLLIMVPVSFYKFKFPTVIPEFTLANYVGYIFSAQTGAVLLNTFGLSALTCFLSFLIGYAVAYTLTFKIQNAVFKTYIISLLLVPFLIDWSIRTVAWISVLGENGFINYLLVSTGIVAGPVKLLFSPISVFIIWLQTYTLFMMFPIYLAMNRIDPDYIRAAQVLRASPSRVQYDIIFKLSRPGIATGFAFVFVSTLGDYVTPSLWAGGIQTLGLSIASYAGNYLWPQAAAMSMVMLIITLVALYLLVTVGNIKKLIYER
jgi:ABC-type spermidine/putrescine transport system permease subunit I